MNGPGGFDGQFVAVTLAALWGGWVLLRPLLPSRGTKKAAGPPCGHCSASSSCSKGTKGGKTVLVSLGSGSRREVQPAEQQPAPR